ncbi:Uu.00g041130.m01.CDS01 [Anthostomella pinea]|uniref:Uu.00g041130.m01.CDS01 n=1 Tax=Anthostomella pinea TaxID=933095 RepID=A0AAI8VAC1_9PEZI|nr:Uu.00g041130.m01.CDS01 [Anthostomella pinea]
MARKLVTVRRVSSIRPIPASSNVSIASIDGWNCGVLAGQVTQGDLVLFFEVDSFLPDPKHDPRFGHGNSPIHHTVTTWQGNRGIHVKSVTIGRSSEISQGVALNLKEFPEVEAGYAEAVQKSGPVA